MIKAHKHDLYDGQETWNKLKSNYDDDKYDIYYCEDVDCDYHEFRYKERS